MTSTCGGVMSQYMGAGRIQAAQFSIRDMVRIRIILNEGEIND